MEFGFGIGNAGRTFFSPKINLCNPRNFLEILELGMAGRIFFLYFKEIPKLPPSLGLGRDGQTSFLYFKEIPKLPSSPGSPAATESF